MSKTKAVLDELDVALFGVLIVSIGAGLTFGVGYALIVGGLFVIAFGVLLGRAR